MSLFGGRCVRCGERTHQTYQGNATCGTCRDELEVALAEATEGQRICPIDSTGLTKTIAHGVIIDRCGSCGGVWLDAGELERVNRVALQEVALTAGFTRPLA
jgi:Transcription factor zinc-finger